MPEVPEHLLKRSRERRKALGLPVEGEEPGEATAADAPPTGADVGDAGAEESVEAVAAASDAGDAITEDKGGIPAHLLERSRKRKAALAGGGAEAEPAAAGATRTATAVATPTPTSAGPGGHTQRLLTVVKSGSIQQTRAEAQDKVH